MVISDELGTFVLNSAACTSVSHFICQIYSPQASINTTATLSTFTANTTPSQNTTLVDCQPRNGDSYWQIDLNADSSNCTAYKVCAMNGNGLVGDGCNATVCSSANFPMVRLDRVSDGICDVYDASYCETVIQLCSPPGNVKVYRNFFAIRAASYC